ncbi:hypothetical protein IJD44_03985 [bacterium]|nr:hypothetical protein [bacterium]
MDISSSLNQPVGFYTKSTGNTINTALSSEGQSVVSNVFSAEINEQIIKRKNIKQDKRIRKSKRLNTMDSDYLPDEAIDEESLLFENEENIFVSYDEKKPVNRIKKVFKYFFENMPLLNYFFLKKKKFRIEKAVMTLHDISRNVDEMLNTAVPYGEENVLYSNIARNLNEAATIIVNANKDM